MALAGLRDGGRRPGQDNACCGFGVQGVVLSLPAVGATVRPVHLHDPVATCAKVPDQTSAPAAGPHDADRAEIPQFLRPLLESPVPARCGRDRQFTEAPPELIQCDSDVEIAVGVDADRDDRRECVRRLLMSLLHLRDAVMHRAGRGAPLTAHCRSAVRLCRHTPMTGVSGTTNRTANMSPPPADAARRALAVITLGTFTTSAIHIAPTMPTSERPNSLRFRLKIVRTTRLITTGQLKSAG